MRTYIQGIFALHATAWKKVEYDVYQRQGRDSSVFELEDELELEIVVEERLLVTDDDQIIEMEVEPIVDSSFINDAGRVLLAPPNLVYTVQPTQPVFAF